MVWLVEDREATERRIRDSILELCRLNLDRTEGSTSSSYEIDGIICITAHGEDGGADTSEQLVVKLHEFFMGKSRHELQAQSSWHDSRPSILRGYLSANSGSLPMGGTVITQRPQQSIHQHRQMLPLHYPNDKRKTIDENDNAVLAPVKRTMLLANQLEEKLPFLRTKNPCLQNGKRPSTVVPMYDDADVLDLRDTTVSSRDHHGTKSADSQYGSSSPCEPCSLNFQSTSTPRNCTPRSNGLELVDPDGQLLAATKAEVESVEPSSLVKVKIEVKDGCSSCQAEELVCDQHQSVAGSNESAGIISNRRKQIKPKKGVALDDHQIGVDSLLTSKEDADVVLNGEWSSKSEAIALDISPLPASFSENNEKISAMNGRLGIVDESGIMRDMQEGSTDIIRSLLQRKQSPSGSTGAAPLECWNNEGSRCGTSGGSVSVHNSRSSLFERPSPRFGLPRLYRGYIPRRSPDSTASSSPFPHRDIRSEGRKSELEESATATNWSCPHCSEALEGFEAFSAHCRTIHKRHACPYCLQTFTQRVNRDRHLYNHTGEKPYDCAQCGFGFTRRDALRKHQQRTNHGIYGKFDDALPTLPAHSGLGSVTFSRPQSAASSVTTFSPEKGLGVVNHVLRGTGGDEGQGCSWADDVEEGGLDLSITSTVNRSQSSVIDDAEVKFQRNVPCDNDADDDSSLISGRSAAVDAWNKSIEQKIREAGKDVVTSGGLKSIGGSFDRKHRPERRSDFRRRMKPGKESLRIKFVMSGGRALSVTSGGAATASNEGGTQSSPVSERNSDSSYVETDEPRRVYRCDVCATSSVGATAYLEHCRNAHRRTPCTYCAKTFSQKGNMERHRRQHTGERPFRCAICSAAYTRKETLRAHMSQSHEGVTGGGPASTTHEEMKMELSDVVSMTGVVKVEPEKEAESSEIEIDHPVGSNVVDP